jgi:gluconolactonase
MTPFSGETMAATRIPNAPPADTFNNMGNDYTNVEGPVWIGDALYYSEMTTANLPPARILKMTADDMSSVFIDMAGSNGLATDGTNIISANHGAQGIVKFALPDKTATTLVSMFDGKKFNCPNDLTVASDGTIYFTDPDYQNNTKPQGTTSVYQLKNGTATVVTDYNMEPNGISLSLDEQTLLVGGRLGVKKYAITNGTVAMTGTAFGPTEVTASGVNTDGMTLDCAGNLYVAVGNSTNVVVVKPDGTKLGTITISGAQAVTNVAFGGTDHQTLYLTGQGSGKNQGVFKLHLNIPGKPY